MHCQFVSYKYTTIHLEQVRKMLWTEEIVWLNNSEDCGSIQEQQNIPVECDRWPAVSGVNPL